MKVLDVLWIGNYGINIVGIIKAQDVITKEIKFYVGTGKGESEEADIAIILAGGQKYSKENFQGFFRNFLEMGD